MSETPTPEALRALLQKVEHLPTMLPDKGFDLYVKVGDVLREIRAALLDAQPAAVTRAETCSLEDDCACSACARERGYLADGTLKLTRYGRAAFKAGQDARAETPAPTVTPEAVALVRARMREFVSSDELDAIMAALRAAQGQPQAPSVTRAEALVRLTCANCNGGGQYHTKRTLTPESLVACECCNGHGVVFALPALAPEGQEPPARDDAPAAGAQETCKHRWVADGNAPELGVWCLDCRAHAPTPGSGGSR